MRGSAQLLITITPTDSHAIGIRYRHTVIGSGVALSCVLKVNLAMPFVGVSISTRWSPVVTATFIPTAGEPSGLLTYSCEDSQKKIIHKL